MGRYASLSQVRDQAQIVDLADDAQLQIALDAAEEAVDAYCGRRFDEVDTSDPTAATVRLYRPRTDMRVIVDDLAAVDTVETGSDGVVWRTVGTVETQPLNAAADGLPFTSLVGRFDRRVRVTGWFGWQSTPDRVVQATLLQASRLAQRRNAQFGVAPTPGLDGGGMRLLAKLDADVELLLWPLKRLRVPT